MRHPLLVLLSGLACATVWAGEEAPAASGVSAPEVHIESVDLKVPWNEPGGLGFAIGYDNGLFGGGFGQGVRFKIPFGRYLGLNLRGLSVMGGSETFVHYLGGRAELLGQTPIFLNVMRLYGGGGFQLFYPVNGVPSPALLLGGGGQFGFEFFMGKRAAFFLEVGGNGGGRTVSGATVLAGINVYPF